MGKIKSKFLKARSVLSVTTYKQPKIFIILIMILINIIILCIAAFIALLIDDSFVNFIDALANGSLKWMLTPNAILAIDNPNTLVLAVVVLVIGLVLFSGTIIALTTNMIKDYFQKKDSGSGKIYLDKHIIILNWNNKVPELVADLLHVKKESVTVMIITTVDKLYAEKQIINAVQKTSKEKETLKKLNVLVKQGDPLITSDLTDVSIEAASTIIIMNKEAYEPITKDMTKSDLNIIKTILSVGRLSYKNNPPIVAEIKQIETKQKIKTISNVVKSLNDFTILPICFDRRLGQIIAQTIIHNWMEDIYLSLFSFEGSEIYHLNNTTFEECLNNYNDAIPLARDGDNLFVLSEDNEVKTNQSKQQVESVPLKMKPLDEVKELEVYIIGSNNKLSFITDSFDEYHKLYNTSFKSRIINEDEIPKFVKQVNNSTSPITIVLLSDETSEDDSLDANVINHLIYIQGHLTRDDVNIIVELLDPKNDNIIKDFDINNTIISNKIISLLLSKLALYEKTASFYEGLLTLEINDDKEDDQEVTIKQASELFDMDFPLLFTSKKEFIISVYESFHKTIIPFGYFHKRELHIISNNMHQKQELIIQKDDYIVLMKL